MSAKTVTVWVLGGVFLLIGVWIIRNLQFDIGVSEFSYIMTLLISLVLFLLAGLCWVSVAVATKR